MHRPSAAPAAAAGAGEVPAAAPEAAALPAAAQGPAYTRAEKVADAAVHCVGVALALMGVPVMIVLAALLDGTGPVIAGVSVYAAGMLLMLGCSAAYHLLPAVKPAWGELLRRFDHAAIYLKIAATQTPFAVLIGGAGAAWVLGSVWIAALGGAVLRIFWPRGFRRLAVPFYLALGWAGLALFWPGAGEASLGLATVILCAVGGVLYTLGVPFLLAERLRFHNAIWHGFVLVATFVFYAAVLAEMGLRAAAAPG